MLQCFAAEFCRATVLSAKNIEVLQYAKKSVFEGKGSQSLEQNRYHYTERQKVK